MEQFYSILQSNPNTNDSNVLKKQGNLLYESHDSLRENFEASWARADQIVEYVQSLEPFGVYGSRMMGGWFGGSILIMVDKTRQQEIIDHLEKWFVDSFRRKTKILQFSSSTGTEVSNITKEEIPASINYLFR